MNKQQLQLKKDTLNTIKEKFFSGKAAFELADLNHLYKQFEDELKNAVKNKTICKTFNSYNQLKILFKPLNNFFK